MNTSACARYARYTSAGGYGRAPASNITGVSRSAETARETARRSPALPGTIYKGRVSTLLPEVNPATRTLKARDFVVDYRPPVGVRLSPHFYNTMDEIDRVMAEIAAIAAAKDYADGGTSSLVT
jgi:selenocysteine lyase/cysteine desulfurase